MARPSANQPLAGSASFQAFLADIACLGVTPVATDDGVSYGVFRARSNDRYWLAPLAPRRATRAGLAMFQPVSRSAVLAKAAALGAIGLNLDAFWARQRIRLSGLPRLDVAIPGEMSAVAYFTGTEGPHRKTTIQCMSAEGDILGYGKLTRNNEVAGHLEAEAAALELVGRLGLKSASSPRLLGMGQNAGAKWLVTDSRKGSATRVQRSLGSAHVAFLRELAERTATFGAAAELVALLDAAEAQADPAWARRFGKGAALLRAWGEDIETGLAHGDFTPWNCFRDPDGLYVFDWEYAHETYPLGFDLVRFLLSRPTETPPREVNAGVVERLAVVHFAGDAERAARHHIACLLIHAAFYQDRQFRVGAPTGGWHDADRYGRLIDAADPSEGA